MNAKHQEKVKELAESIAASLKIEAERLYRSGAVDVESYDPDQYRLAKVLISAAMHRINDDYKPSSLDIIGKRDVKNLIRV